MLTCRSRGTPAKAPSLRVEGFTAIPKDHAVFLALLQLVPDWVLQVGLCGQVRKVN